MAMFQRDDWTLFRNLATLGQKAGVPQSLLARLVLKELTDNALDANRADGSAPHCDVGQLVSNRINPSQPMFYIVDDGAGIEGDDAAVASLFSIKRPLTSTKLVRLPTRGALGNGLRVVAGAVLASGGTLVVRTRGRWLHLVPLDDGTTRCERLDSSSPATFAQDSDPDAGTRVHISFGPALVKPNEDAHTHLSMARLALRMRGESCYEGRTSAHWYDSDSFFELLQAAGDAHLADLLDRFELTSGYVKRTLKASDALTFAGDVQREAAEELLTGMRANKSTPKVSALGEVGEGAYKCHGYAKKTTAFVRLAARGAHNATIPAVIEVWATKLDRKTDSDPTATVFVNRTPITATVSAGLDSGREGRTWLSGCGLRHYFKTGRAPMQLLINVTCPYMPITTDGKEPDLLPIADVLGDAIASATRKAKVATSTERGTNVDTKASLIAEVLPAAKRHASGDGAHRFSLRQLYYKVRPLLHQRGVEEELSYTYFATVVTKIEAALGHDIPGMYRDARGTLYHPHTGEQIALGTLNVEGYKPPEFRFNKVLYIEKGGFFPLLIDAKWAERHDCALLTSQGFASRAARDVIDLIGDADLGGPLQFFAIHDSDGPGTLLYEKLVEATLARGARTVEVVNLGLEPWEGKGMGLEVETFERAHGGRVPVADYIRRRDRFHYTDWEEWLQGNRYELNAMSSPEFLTWLDAAFDKHAQHGKVIPPAGVLEERFMIATRKAVRDALIQDAIQTLCVDERTDILLDTLHPDGERLHDAVRYAFDASPTEKWEDPLARLALAEAAELTDGAL